MRLLALVSWPQLRRHVLRSAFTVAGIALGVAVFVAMNGANRSLLKAFSQTVDRVAGKAELQVSAGEAGFAEDVLEQVQALPSVGVAVPVIEAVAETGIRGEGSLMILGVDFTGDRSLRSYDLQSGEDGAVDDPLVFLAQPDSIIVSSAFARANRLQIGSRLPLATVNGEKRFTVRGIMKTGGLASAFGGSLAVMDIYAAQKMFGRGQRFDRIDLALAPGRSLEQARSELAARLGPGYQVETPSNRGQHFEAMIAAYSVMMRASSLFAMFIGMFIIYNGFSIAVTERRTEIGILRALGATRGQIQRLFLAESALAGVAGSVAGIGIGVIASRFVADAVSALIGGTSGVAQARGSVAVEPAFLLVALGAGVVTSVIAAFVPARIAALTDPVQTLQSGSHQTLSRTENRWRLGGAAVLGGLALATVGFGGSRSLFYTGYLLLIVAAVLAAPFACLWLARALRPAFGWLRPVEGALAADSLVQAPRRTSTCVAALMLSLAMVIAFSGMARASFGSIADWANTVLNPDAFLLPSPEVTSRAIRFPVSMAAELAAVPGVADVQMVRQLRLPFRGAPVMLMAVQFAKMARTTNLKVVEGEQRTIFREAAGGRGLLVSENLAARHGLHLGELFELPAPGGLLRLPIVGIVRDYVDQQGVVLVDRAVYERLWRDDSVNVFRLYFAPGATFDDVKRRILARYADQRRVFVLANREMKDYILGLAGQWFRITDVQIGIAVLVAVLGIVNTLAVSITDRRREFGVLRSVGAMRWQVRRTIQFEAAGVAMIGLVLGIALGGANLWFVLQIIRQDVIGMRFPYEFPASTLLVLVPLMLVAALLAAAWPSRAAMRGSLVEALAHE